MMSFLLLFFLGQGGKSGIVSGLFVFSPFFIYVILVPSYVGLDDTKGGALVAFAIFDLAIFSYFIFAAGFRRMYTA